MTRYSKYYDTKPSVPCLPFGLTYRRICEIAAEHGWTVTQPSYHYFRLEMPTGIPFQQSNIMQFHSVEALWHYISNKLMGLRPQYA